MRLPAPDNKTSKPAASLARISLTMLASGVRACHNGNQTIEVNKPQCTDRIAADVKGRLTASWPITESKGLSEPVRHRFRVRGIIQCSP